MAVTVGAETYDVNASVPYDPPTQAATIESPDPAVALDNLQQTITGTCQVQNPTVVVTVLRDGSVLGSAGCNGGYYSVAVVLIIGQNKLIVKTANVNGLYGPDSAPKTYTINRPIVATPLPQAVSQPTTVRERSEAINQGGLSGLSVVTETPFETLPSSKRVVLRVGVHGGQQPYTLQLNWGDGSTESHSLDSAGTYEFTHTYRTYKAYTVYTQVRDLLGAYTEHVYAVVSSRRSSSAADAGLSVSGAKPHSQWQLLGVVWYRWLIIVCLFIILVGSYVIGYRRGRKHVEDENVRSEATSRKNRKRAKP